VADVDQLPPMPPGMSSVMAPPGPAPTNGFGGPQVPFGPYGVPDQQTRALAAQHGIDPVALDTAGVRGDIQNQHLQNPDVSYQRQISAQQAAQLNQLNNQRQHVASMLAQGVIHPQDAATAIRQIDFQTKALSQPMMVPKVKPTPMAEEYKDRVYTDPDKNVFIRQNDGTWDVRPPSPHAPEARFAHQFHEAGMAHDKHQRDKVMDARDKLHDVATGANAPQGSDLAAQGQAPHMVAQEAAKAEEAKNKADLAATNKQNTQQVGVQKQAEIEANRADAAHKAAAAEWDRKSKEFHSTREKYADKAEQQWVTDNQPKEGQPLPTKPAREVFEKQAEARIEKEQQESEARFGKRPEPPPLPPPGRGTPTMAPPGQASGSTERDPRDAALFQSMGLDEQGNPRQGPQQAPAALQHPSLKPEAPPEVHAARFQIDRLVASYGEDPTKWPPDVLAHAKELTKQVKPYRK
jgi:hypothetical protein